MSKRWAARLCVLLARAIGSLAEQNWWKGGGNEQSTNATVGQGISGDAPERRTRSLSGPGGQEQGAAILGAHAGARWRIYDRSRFEIAGQVQTGVALRS